MKLIIFPGNFVPHIGGLETHVDEFSKYFSKYADITIFTPMTCGGIDYEIRHGKVKVIRYPATQIVTNYFIPKFWSRSFWKCFNQIKRERYDWVMTRTMFFVNSTIGMMFAKFRLKRIKLIHVEHGASYPKTTNPMVFLFSRLYLFLIGNIHTRLSDKIVCVSNMSKKYTENFWHENDIHVIYRGVDVSRINNIKAKKIPKNSIVYAGRLIEGKGVHDLLNSTINEKYDIYIIGEGGMLSKLKTIAKRSKCNIHFLGKLSYDETISYMKGSDIVINPSYSEGLPTTVLDGIFSGAKIIATNVGGTYEILGKNWGRNGYALIKPQDIIEMKNAIKKVLSEKKEKINLNSLEFDWKKHAENYYKLM